MKNIRILKWAFLSFAFTLTTLSFGQSTNKKEYHKVYAANQVKMLMMEAKFGNTVIKDNGSDQVTVDVVVEANEGNQKTIDRILESIDIEIELSGGMLMIETNIESGGKGSFSINYDINIPKNKDVMASSKYGNLHIEELTGKGTFEIAYGNITAKKLNTKTRLLMELAYGNGTIGEMRDGVMEVKYSNLDVGGNAGQLDIEGKYSKFNFNTLHSLNMESKSDVIKLDEAHSIVMEMGYSNITVQKLHERFIAETAYGNVKIRSVEDDFKQIAVENKYGDIQLGIGPNATYKVDMEGNYCDINIPSSNRLSTEKERQSIHVYGIVGEGEPQGSIVTSSNYGNIRISTK